MSYENAPATKLLATHCAVCARPLVDAVSVETGIGPDCRKKFGFNDFPDHPARLTANALVYKIALRQTGADVAAAADDLRKLGFEKLAKRILERVIDIRIEATAGGYNVKFPYSEQAVFTIKGVSGRRWMKEVKAWFVPTASKPALQKFLNDTFPGATAIGPKGIFIVGAKVAPAAKPAPVAQKAPVQAELLVTEPEQIDALAAIRAKFTKQVQANPAILATWGTPA
jgi:hypothetical protein